MLEIEEETKRQQGRGGAEHGVRGGDGAEKRSKMGLGIEEEEAGHKRGAPRGTGLEEGVGCGERVSWRQSQGWDTCIRDPVVRLLLTMTRVGKTPGPVYHRTNTPVRRPARLQPPEERHAPIPGPTLTIASNHSVRRPARLEY